MPIDFSLLSSKKAQINGINVQIDKRCSGYKRRVEVLQTSPEQIPYVIERTLKSGVEASYVFDEVLISGHIPNNFDQISVRKARGLLNELGAKKKPKGFACSAKWRRKNDTINILHLGPRQLTRELNPFILRA